MKSKVVPDFSSLQFSTYTVMPFLLNDSLPTIIQTTFDQVIVCSMNYRSTHVHSFQPLLQSTIQSNDREPSKSQISIRDIQLQEKKLSIYFSFLSLLCDICGYKLVYILFPHEVELLEPVLSYIQCITNDEEYFSFFLHQSLVIGKQYICVCYGQQCC